MATTADAKRALRAEARQARARIAPAARAAAAQELAAIGLGFLAPPPGAVIAGYHPLRDEIDPLPLLARLEAAGFAVALPAHAPGAREVTFHRWREGEPLAAGEFGVLMPLPDAPLVTPDVVLAPLLAFDATGHRLGYGAGYYDRSIAHLRAHGPVTVAGLAFDEQEVPAVPHEPLDQRLDWIVTPRGPRRCEGA